nr:protein heat intolerant 4 [Tanacetum cinerariifolium]
ENGLGSIYSVRKQGASVERLSSQIFILSCVERRAGLKHLKLDHVKKFEYCLPYFYHPFREDETEQNTVVDIIFPAEQPVICEFDWELDELEEFTNDLVASEMLTEDQKDEFKEFVKEKTSASNEGLAECKASTSNLRRIQVRDIIKEVKDYLKTYSSAMMDISCVLPKLAGRTIVAVCHHHHSRTTSCHPVCRGFDTVTVRRKPALQGLDRSLEAPSSNKDSNFHTWENETLYVNSERSQDPGYCILEQLEDLKRQFGKRRAKKAFESQQNASKKFVDFFNHQQGTPSSQFQIPNLYTPQVFPASISTPGSRSSTSPTPSSTHLGLGDCYTTTFDLETCQSGEQDDNDSDDGNREYDVDIYDEEYGLCRIVLSIDDKLTYLEQPIPPTLVAPKGQQIASEIIAAHIAWIKGSKKIAGLMLMTMKPEIQRNLKNLHAHEMLQELKTLFSQQAEQELLQTTRDFHSCKQEEGLGKTINELLAMLKLHEQTLPKNNAPTLHVIRAGHWKRNCPQYLSELLKKKKLSQGASNSGIFTIKLNIFLNRPWIYDTGCGTHICNTTQGPRASRKLKSEALSLYVGNGQCEAVEAIGAIYLCLPSGLEIVLNNFHYAPFITRGLIYVSRFAIPRDGIFEIDLSNSYANDSSIKKRIEKLQHDGLLILTDLRAFEKCVSCMSEKMARKPYTHQVDRAKDLLGLIHTDHKHEVFKTFKVFQKEVENQLGKIIKSLRSDRGGEYMSQEFLNHLKDHGIIAHRTPPYTPQHNENSLVTQEASGSLEDLEIIQEEDTHLSIDNSLNHEEDDLKIDEPQSDIIPIRRSTKTRHAPDRMCLYTDAEEHKLEDLGEPANYKAALLDPGSDKWLNAMNVEMQSMKENEKTEMDGAVHTYKARLVAKGYTQTPGIDYEETLSPVADIRAIRILIAITAFYDYEIWCFAMKDLGEAAYIRGIKIYRDRSRRLIEKLRLSKSQGASTPAELKRMQNVPYASAVGSI